MVLLKAFAVLIKILSTYCILVISKVSSQNLFWDHPRKVVAVYFSVFFSLLYIVGRGYHSPTPLSITSIGVRSRQIRFLSILKEPVVNKLFLH